MSSIKKILVFTATYNESENIVKLIETIENQNLNLDILIIDDNSPDGTAFKVEKLQQIYKNLFLKIREKKEGLDTAHKNAFKFAKEKNYDLFISMDADLSHDPRELKNFILELEEYPFVIGSRYIDGGECLMKKKRLFLSKYGNLIIKYFLNIGINEYTTSYRGFNLNKLENFDLNHVQGKGYSFFMDTIFQVNSLGINIKEIPIIFKDRSKGHSKIPKFEIFRTIKNLIIIVIKKFFR
tara:strand:+ start:613 stop:1329 length:717 start_codon:yes stop_codon:yes gene_type:complete